MDVPVTADWSERARAGKLGRAIAREAEVDKVLQILLRPKRNSVTLAGEPGVGKTAVVKEIACRLAEDSPAALSGWSVRYTSAPSLTATDSPAILLEHFEAALREAVAPGRTILVIDDFGRLFSRRPVPQQFVRVLEDALAAASLRCIAVTTPEGFRDFERFPVAAREFCRLEVLEPAFETAVSMLRYWNEHFGACGGVTIADEAVSATADLAYRCLPGCLPGKAVDCIRSAQIRKSGGLHERTEPVTALDIAEEVARRTSIPVANLAETFREKLERLKGRLEAGVQDRVQAGVIDLVAQALRRKLAQSRPAHGPLGALLFWGPPGGGKSPLVESLAEFLFDEATALIRLDMAEYESESDMQRLFYQQDCYSGQFFGVGRLTEPVWRRASSLVEFRHIEKADKCIFDIIVEILDRGQIPDRGRVVSFRNTLVVLTMDVDEEPDWSEQDERGYPRKFLSRMIPLYVLGRLDGIIQFKTA